MVFLAGDHYLNTSFEISSIRELRLVSNGSIIEPSKIICQGVGWKFGDISYTHLSDISIISCGNEHSSGLGLRLPALSIADIQVFDMVNVSVQDSYGNAIFSQNSGISLQNSSFVRNGRGSPFLGTSFFGGAISAIMSNISMEDVSFVNNSAYQGGAIYAALAYISMEDVSFVNNSASEGGAIYAYIANSIMKGDVSFLNNSAGVGGAVSAISASTLSMEGDVSFFNNSAEQDGGAIHALSSNIIMVGDVSFLNNCAKDGGAVFAYSSSISMEGNVSFFNSSAYRGGSGGAIYATLENISMGGDVSIFNNRAENGGAIFVENSNISMDGDVSFLNNSAQKQGGAIEAISSSISMEGDVSFHNNNAVSYGGAIFTNFAIFTNLASNISMKGDVSFFNNSAIFGGAIFATLLNIGMTGNVSFLYNHAQLYDGGAIIGFNVQIIMDGNVMFLENSAPLGLGGAMNLVGSSCNHLENAHLVFQNNQAARGGAIFASDSTCYLRGDTNFTDNHAIFLGGAISAQTSNVHVEGKVQFLNNSAQLGGSVYLEHVSHVYFSSTTDLIFQHNEAKRGGAIFVRDSTYFVSCAQIGTFFYPPQIVLDSCAIVSFNATTGGFEFGSLTFDGNTASDRGDVIFGGYPQTCVQIFSISEQLGKTLPLQDDPLSVSSEPLKLKLCNHGNLPLELDDLSRGETFRISVMALDQSGSPVPATIRAYFTFSDKSTTYLVEDQSAQKIDAECTTLNYTVFSTLNTVDLYIYAEEGVCGSNEAIQIIIHLQECPLAFVLDHSQCVCEKRLQKFTNSCSVENRSFKRTQGSTFWVGIERQNGTYLGLILESHCPLDYCRSDEIDVSTEDLDSQCQFNRVGTLCGACGSNFSLALGGSQCLECTNSHLALLIVFAVAGIVLVFIISVLRLTVSIGTISGLIFYANIVAVNRAIFIPQGTTNILTVFISWLNLDFGIVTCFFDGMDAYTLTWLQYVFPSYIWLIAIAIILISQRSVRISNFLGKNPVSVLTTLFLLSYAKILRTIITSLSVITLEYPDNSTHAVWLYDGNIDYSKGKHIPLFAFSLIVLLLLFLPYTLFLFFSQWLQVLSNWKILFWMNSARIKFFLDTYHAPYSVKHRYWPGLLLLIRCALFVIFASNPSGDPSVNLLCISSASLGLAVFRGAINIYSNWLLDILEGSFILNLGILAGATYHVRLSGGNQNAVTYLSISVALTEFVGIVIYHAIMQLKDTVVVKRIQMMKVFRRNEEKEHILGDSEIHDVNGANNIQYSRFRESVLYVADD